METDKVLEDIADYVLTYKDLSSEALTTARYCLLDAIGCGLAALQYPECVKLLGPVVEGTVVPTPVHVPGTNFELDPVTAAFNIGTIVRWLDWNDTFLGKEWDNFGSILAVAEYLSQLRGKKGEEELTMREVVEAGAKAYEIQGCLALENSFNEMGLDHVLLVRVASTAVVATMLGCSRDEVINAVSNAWMDGGALRAYRHFPNTGSRKSWAAGDATSRAVWHALNAKKGEMGYKTVLSAPRWGFLANLFGGKELKFQRPYGSYIMENILFKASFPAEFHAQTAVECALQLHSKVASRLEEVKLVKIWTQEPAVRIIDKKGELKNPADRDHCIQYMTAVGLIFGELSSDYYEEEVSKDERIDALRAKMEVVEDKRYTEEYYDPEKRSIANAVQVFFTNGTETEKVEVEYPIGHRRRRKEGVEAARRKLDKNLALVYSPERCKQILGLFDSEEQFQQMSVCDFMKLLAKE